MIRNGLRVRAKTSPDTSEVAEPSPIDADLVRELAQLVGESDLAEIEIEKGDLRIRLTRHHRHPAPAAVAMPAPVASPVALMQAAPALPLAGAAPMAAAELDPASLLKSPMVGTVYRRANPEAKPFVELGATVKTGDRVLLVEAMKTFNDIVAHRAGTVSAILIEDGQPVEYGEPLLVIT